MINKCLDDMKQVNCTDQGSIDQFSYLNTLGCELFSGPSFGSKQPIRISQKYGFCKGGYLFPFEVLQDVQR